MMKAFLTPKALGLVWSIGFKAFLLVLIIVGLIALVAWLVTELIWRQKNKEAQDNNHDNTNQ